MSISMYPEDFDYVWIASDSNGNVGAFVTGGSGPIPILALKNTLLPLDNVEEAISSLSKYSEVNLLVQVKRPDDFISMAQRGFFVYDWRDVHRIKNELTHVYEIVAIPVNPITVSMLPPKLNFSARLITFTDTAYRENFVLNIMDKILCCIKE